MEGTIVETPEGPVLVPAGPSPVLTDEIVRETLERVRRDAERKADRPR
jgi:hypothetical protein